MGENGEVKSLEDITVPITSLPATLTYTRKSEGNEDVIYTITIKAMGGEGEDTPSANGILEVKTNVGVVTYAEDNKVFVIVPNGTETIKLSVSYDGGTVKGGTFDNNFTWESGVEYTVQLYGGCEYFELTKSLPGEEDVNYEISIGPPEVLAFKIFGYISGSVSAAEKCVLYVAWYENGILKQTKTIEMEPGWTELPTEELKADTTWDTVELMLWKDRKSMIPMCESKIIKNK